jgi:hypothetical protein
MSGLTAGNLLVACGVEVVTYTRNAQSKAKKNQYHSAATAL